MYHYICSSSLRPHAFRHIHAASFAQLYAPCYAPQYVHRQLEASCICSVCARMLCIHPQISSAFYREQKNSAIYRENKKSEKKTEEKRNSYSAYTLRSPPQFTTLLPPVCPAVQQLLLQWPLRKHQRPRRLSKLPQIKLKPSRRVAQKKALSY